MTAPEQLPDTWDSDRDDCFFRITARVLPSAVAEAASALLASYDDPGVEPSRLPASGPTPVAHRGPGTPVRDGSSSSGRPA